MKKKLLIMISIFMLLICGCEEKQAQVLVSAYPLQYIVLRIAGDYVKCEMLSDNTFIQRAQIRSSYQKLLDDSQFLFYISSLEPYMEMYADEIRQSNIEMVDLGDKSGIFLFQRYTITKVNGVEAILETPYYDGEQFNSIETYEKDPLLWLDPVAMTSMANDVYDHLVRLYPEYEAIFKENYDKFELDLARLDVDFQKIRDSGKKIRFVSMTPSFGNWQKSYGIEVYPISLSKYGALPSSEQLELIKNRIRKDHVRYMAVENNISKDMEQLRDSLVNELGLIEVPLDNLSSLSNEERESGKDYMSAMYHNIEVLESIEE